VEVEIREFSKQDIKEMIFIWNQVVEDGVAFPQMDCLDAESGLEFFASQSFTGVAVDKDSNSIVGLYILHPNNIGRCGHICNASYAVLADMRGHHLGEQLVKHCLAKGKELGYKILQFNAVVSSNYSALKLYEKLGFVKLGLIPGGFLMKNGEYQDIIPHYHLL